MKKTKLKLSRETVRVLSNDQLASAAGGYLTDYCSDGPACPTDNCPTFGCPPESDNCQVTVGCNTFGTNCVGSHV